MLTWQAHKSAIEAMAFSADGRVLATATGGTRTVNLWDPTTGKLVRKLTADWPDGRTLGRVKSVAFARGAPLLAAGTDRSVTVWRADTWELLADLERVAAYELAFGPGVTPVLAASSAYSAALWEDPGRPTGTKPRRPDRSIAPPHYSGVAALDFSPDGKLLVTSTKHDVILWNPATGKRLRTLRQGRTTYRGRVRFSPDGSKLAFCHGKWAEVRSATDDAAPAVKVQAGTGRFPAVWAVNWSADGRGLLTASGDGIVRFWDAATGAELRSFDWGIGKLYCAAFSPDGLTCAACGEKGQVVVWDVDG
jgi:WD40 repeat protein